ncbi:MAG: T9SS type A sorting domain-containing protein [Bacteroidia bacterium]|nr:T9SS type A sorting domain-containing protein [Bacteroidia bacterium]
MKKFYVLLISAVLFSVSSYAQTVAPFTNLAEYQEENLNLDISNLPELTKNSSNKAFYTEWMSPVSNWEDQGAFFQGPSFMRLHPDSGVVIVPSDGTEPFGNGFHLIGTVFQPTEPFYELQTGWLMNNYDSYKVDSIRMPYAYIRYTDSMDVAGSMVNIVDTAVVHFYTADQLDDWYMSATDDRFAIPKGENFSVDLLGPTDVLFTDTILLTKAAATDTVNGETIALGTLQFAVPAGINEISDNSQTATYDNTIGVSLVYKPMQPYEFGDTLASFDDNAQPQILLNNFGSVTYGNDGTGMPQESHFNNTFTSNRQVRYGQEFGPLKGYLATMAFFGWTRDFFFDADFLVTVEDPSGVASVKDNLGVTAYPNPAKMGQEIMVKIEENVAIENVTITMTDLLGNVISDNFAAVGPKEFSLATDRLAGGVYLINVKADNASSTIRVILAD